MAATFILLTAWGITHKMIDLIFGLSLLMVTLSVEEAIS